MSPARVVCPHCNTVVDIETAIERIDCPRCGELFDPCQADDADALLPTVMPRESPTTPPPQSFLHSPAAMALSFAIAGLILGVGLWLTQPWESRSVPPKIEAKLPVVVPPLGLTGLSYLPKATSAVAAFQPMPLLIYAAQSKTDPKKLFLDAGLPEPVWGFIEKTGLPLDQIDHLLVGVTLRTEPGAILPGVTGCLKLTRPIADETKFLTSLKAEKNSQQSKAGRTVYSIAVGVPLLLTKKDELTYLLGLDAVDLATIDAPAPQGCGHLNKELTDALSTRLSPTSFFALATDSDRWSDRPTFKLLAGLPEGKKLATKLASGRAITLGLSCEPEPQLRLGVRVADDALANEVRESFRRSFPSSQSQFAGENGWATVQTPLTSGDNSLKKLLAEFTSVKPNAAP